MQESKIVRPITTRLTRINSPNEQREILRIEQLHIRWSIPRDHRYFTPEDINQPGQDERVRDERCRAELGEVPDQRQREEDDKLHKNEILHGDEPEAVCYRHDECLREDRVEFICDRDWERDVPASSRRQR